MHSTVEIKGRGLSLQYTLEGRGWSLYSVPFYNNVWLILFDLEFNAQNKGKVQSGCLHYDAEFNMNSLSKGIHDKVPFKKCILLPNDKYYTKMHYAKLHYITLHYTTLH